jgi:hypothetical protein
MPSLISSTAGVFLTNPARANEHRTLNANLRQFIGRHPLFHLEFVIPCNNSNRRRQVLKEACTKIFLDCLTMHKQCVLLHYDKALGSLTILYYLEDHSFGSLLETSWKTNIQGIFHGFISKFTKSHCCWALKEESKFRYGKEHWSFQGKFSIGNLTELDVTALQKSSDGQFSTEKKKERNDLFGSPARQFCSRWWQNTKKGNGADPNSPTSLAGRFLGGGNVKKEKGQ